VTPRELETLSAEETRALGRELMHDAKPGTVFALYGELGSGKTQLVRGMAEATGVAAAVHSPTFTLVNEYGGSPPFYHLDLYRLKNASELIDIGFEDIVGCDAICVIEWAERAAGLLPPTTVHVYLEHAGGDMRRIRVEDVEASSRSMGSE